MKVLFATDHSTAADEAAWLLARLPFAEPMDLTVLNVISMPHMPGAVGMHPMWPKVVETVKKEAEEANDKLVQKFRGHDGNVQAIVRQGLAAQEIIREAEHGKSDLLVVGALGHTALDRVLLGSVSDRVATHAPCSTLVVRPTGLSADNARPLKVLVAYDSSDAAKQAAEEIAGLKWSSNTEITLVHVLQTVDVFRQDIVQSISELWEKERKRVAEDIAHMAGEFTARGLNVKTMVREAPHAGEEMCRLAAKEKADLVVVGDRGHGAFKRFLLGSISRYVLRHTDSSVWIARTDAA